MAKSKRALGWQNAKFGGHALETSLSARLKADASFSSELHGRLFGAPEGRRPEVGGDGIKAKHVRSVLGDLTQAKADLRVTWPGGATAKVSVKMSYGGQVWLVSLDRFARGYAKHYGEDIPKPVQETLRLFIGPIQKNGLAAIADECPLSGPTKNGVRQEIRQRRLVGDTLKRYDRKAWEETLAWLRANAVRVTELCFARGLCADPEDFANCVWYYVTDKKRRRPAESRVIKIDDILRAIEAMPREERVIVGPRNGGSTLLLPFGFLQMHRPRGENQLQFHHRYEVLDATLAARDRH